MSKIAINNEDVKLLNKKYGLYILLQEDKLDLETTIIKVREREQLRLLQEKLISLQNWIVRRDKKLVIIFEGRDVAGKGGAIQAITEFLNPRNYKTVALGIPSDDERKQWFFQRYINHLPNPGQMVFFDRSWYNRAMVEPVNGFCSKHEYKIFMSQVNEFEKMLVQSDTYLLKFYYAISKEEQARRFELVKSNPLTRWKMSPVDLRAQELWDEYTRYEESMLKKTSTKKVPWTVIDANKTETARIETIKYILDALPYE